MRSWQWKKKKKRQLENDNRKNDNVKKKCSRKITTGKWECQRGYAIMSNKRDVNLKTAMLKRQGEKTI